MSKPAPCPLFSPIVFFLNINKMCPQALHVLTYMILLKVLGAYPTSVSMVGGCPWWNWWLLSAKFLADFGDCFQKSISCFNGNHNLAAW
jgi:hypothetical protein